VIAPDNWFDFLPLVQKILKEAASIALSVKRTPHNDVAAKLLAVREVSQKILDSMELPDSFRWAAYSSFFPDLNTIGIDGHFAVMAAKRNPVKGMRVYPLWKEGHAPKHAATNPQRGKAEPPGVAPIPKAVNGLNLIDSDQTGRGEPSDCKIILGDKWVCKSGAIPIHVPDRLIKPLKAYLDKADSFSLILGEDPYKLASELGCLIREGRKKGFLPYPDRWPSGERKKDQKIPFLRFNKVEGKNKRNTRRHK
jgi:hypothetical protein